MADIINLHPDDDWFHEKCAFEEGTPTLGWPPGLTGRIAQALYRGAYSPIPDIAVVASIAMVNGMAGRAFRTYTDADLAIYLLLIAASGIGKDSIHQGIPAILRLANVAGTMATPHSMTSNSLLRQTDFASGPALHKRLLESPGFLCLTGEFGHKLKQMANPANAPMRSYRELLTNVYNKKDLEGKEYSTGGVHIPAVEWPALSILSESTFATYLECLTSDMMEDGFLSRFTTTYCYDEKPIPRRGDRAYQMSEVDLALLRNFFTHCVKFQDKFKTDAPRVNPTAEAEDMFWQYNLHCREKWIAAKLDAEKFSWNRAHLKALKIASGLAAADNFAVPLVTVEHARWAIKFVQADIEAFLRHYQAGDIGSDDRTREQKVLEICRRFLSQRRSPEKRYDKSFEFLKFNSIVPRGYLQTHTQNVASFRNHRNGSSAALEAALKSLIAAGSLSEVDNTKAGFSYSGKAYRVQ